MVRSRSEISMEDVKAAFNEQRKAARPHPFLATAKDGKRRSSTPGRPSASSSQGISGRLAYSTSPASSPGVGRSPSLRKRGDGSPGQRRGASGDRPAKVTDRNPYPKRVHPTQGGATTRPRKSLPKTPTLAKTDTKTKVSDKGSPVVEMRTKSGSSSSAERARKSAAAGGNALRAQSAGENPEYGGAWEGAYDEDEGDESVTNQWEGAYDDDEDEQIDMGESRPSPVSAARELASELLTDNRIEVTSPDSALTAARAAAAMHVLSPGASPSEVSRTAQAARARRRTKLSATSTEDAQSAAALVAQARASREAATELISSEHTLEIRVAQHGPHLLPPQVRLETNFSYLVVGPTEGSRHVATTSTAKFRYTFNTVPLFSVLI